MTGGAEAAAARGVDPAEAPAMGPRARSPAAALRLQWLLVCGLLGPVLCVERPGLQQTVHLSSYEIITPWRLTRERREAPRPYSEQVSYVIEAQGKQHIIHLERNIDLLPKDFVVYSYDEEGFLLSNYPRVQQRNTLVCSYIF